jgi:glycolate oxidase
MRMAACGTSRTADVDQVPEHRARCQDLRQAAVRLVGKERVRSDETTRFLHSYDASLEHGYPDLVASPRDTGELRALVAAAYHHGVPFVMRGAGTGYSGGALPARGGMVILTSNLDRILDIDTDEGRIRCEPGVVLATVQQHAARGGWRYLPDPSSYQVCTIGGNVAENAGGPHALGGGPTSNYILAVELVLPDGSLAVLDEQEPWEGGLDLRALIVGSEGTLGAIASATLRLVRAPESEQVMLATFARQEDALATVADVFDTGLLPSALDMLTGALVPGRPDYLDPSLLFAGLQGPREEVTDQSSRLSGIVRHHGGRPELLDIPAFLQRRAELVREKVRRMVAASGCPRYYLFDAVAPRSSLAALMDSIRRAAADSGLPVLNTFHAGDGNVHPTPFYDPEDPGHQARLLDFSSQVLQECRGMGGSLSGEHGIGLEKLGLMRDFFPPETLEIMRAVKRAFDPGGLSNPGKVIPPPEQAVTGGPRRGARAARRGRQPALHLRRIDALLEINDGAITFADVAAALDGGPYELPYEPLGADPGLSVIAALDAGLPALREPLPARPRDLIVGADLDRKPGEPAVGLGGSCAKDVAGYELRKLVYGGRGRLGILRAARLRLLPRPDDSRLIRGPEMPVDAAEMLCALIRTVDLPFCYLGVLITASGSASVTGRAELRGGTLERHLGLLQSVRPQTHWDVTTGDRWTDPVMRALADDGTSLAGAPSGSARQTALLRSLARGGRPVFMSAGHRRVWWRGEPPSLSRSDLTGRVVSAFRAGPP